MANLKGAFVFGKSKQNEKVHWRRQQLDRGKKWHLDGANIGTLEIRNVQPVVSMRKDKKKRPSQVSFSKKNKTIRSMLAIMYN